MVTPYQPPYEPYTPPEPGIYPPMSPYGPGVMPNAYAMTQKNVLGTISLVTGIISIVACLGLLSGIPAIITGVLGRKAADQGLANNKGVGTAGMILGIIGTALSALTILVIIASYPNY